ncbi:3'(2'),5'-bisphosphate nucleotidase CysQ [Tomitella fengzijianii]|uniref:3'(2'),5'-bisphosphate nucleotidase CysQ n=1 Tax=Tomitella fengzijianii TaxID=2597660 RepID=A0A516X232_9ACTN|nr:3'(2'),5'-bisphosphate nucleotidase CysQ [Tomitella fengzijianii]QDQ97146.1 3'(2'),5'-bisphosphate nucleotidase CysQ [Tomitella fengzijianii]
MSAHTNDPVADAALAADIAESTGKLLLELRSDSSAIDPYVLRDSGDREAHEYIMGRLAEHFPDDAVLSEEGTDSGARLTAERTWIVDPLDGTNEYGLLDHNDWAVHIALVVGHRAVLGAVAVPALGVTYSSGTVSPVPPMLGDKPRMIISRNRRNDRVTRIADALGAEVLRKGSAGAKAMAVVRGDADIYAHAGGMYEWDSCAPVAVAQAAGLHTSRIDGSPIRYNAEDPWLPDLLICRPELAEKAIAAARV